MIIPYNEIKEILKGSYIDDGEDILVKHSVYKGEREFAFVLIEKCMGLLSKEPVNDKLIVQYLQGLLSLTTPENKHYEVFLNTCVPETSLKGKALAGEKLSLIEIAVIRELMQSNMAEYTMKGEYQRCCYAAMLAFFQTAYCMLEKKLGVYIKHIDMIANLDDMLESIQLYETSEPTDVIIVDWHSNNKINSIYLLYKNQYSGLDNASVLDLVAADVIEEDYYYKDERFSIAPSILTKQYCAIIEHEINEIIQLLNFSNKPPKHLMWRKMKQYVKDNNIDLEATDFSLLEVLEDLYDLRNKGAHGDVITKDEYKIVSKYKNLGLFNGISIEKLRLKNGKISPTIDELKEYMGLD
ncbi:MAG: hypothetical protein HFJ79_05050 [Clostridiales bacterium]|nr:hypothetical protein [Clostridiales bacterium]